MKELKTAVLFCLTVTLLCGGLYPAVVTGIAAALFPRQAAGSLVIDDQGRTIGSQLIGQPFTAPQYFWPRPSATPEFPYNPAASGGSNSGPSNPDFLKTVAQRVQAIRDSGVTGAIPADLILASASGLDPHISPEAAAVQTTRVAMARGITGALVGHLVAAHTEDRQAGFLGEPRINVLALNLALDKVSP
ncbi:MAG: potassium-transporting ATPase subunit KdpC [Desulforhopalus sp.]|nr:potassium-transporting ATPase subunit KdpC [Desulforhopalus sp.]